MQNKVAIINLEYDMPTVNVALQKMKNEIVTYKGQGYKAVIIIHGYGSSGVGGAIKIAVNGCLLDNSMRGIVREFVGGEKWSQSKRNFLSICKSLENYENKIANNDGITIVLLR